jgi:hypothetical protein
MKRERQKLVGLMLLGLSVIGLHLSPACGGPADVDPASCCATNASCLEQSGMSNPQACCEREEESKPVLTFQWNAPLIQKSVPTVRATPVQMPETVAPIAAVFRIERDPHGTPLKFPTRDLVKLHSSFLI